MSESIPPEILAQMEANAMNNPHQLFLVDRLLKIDIGAFVSNITLSNTAPNGQMMAVCTVTTSTENLHAFATSILEAIEGQAAKIKADQAVFLKRLSKA